MQLEIVFIVSRPCVHKCKHLSPGAGQQDILGFKGSSLRITTTDEMSPLGLQKIPSPHWLVCIEISHLVQHKNKIHNPNGIKLFSLILFLETNISKII